MEVVMQSALWWARGCGQFLEMIYEKLLNEALWDILVTLFHVVGPGGFDALEPLQTDGALQLIHKLKHQVSVAMLANKVKPQCRHVGRGV